MRTIAFTGCLLICTGCLDTELNSDQPNIIFVLTDDQRYDELGILNPLLETPNMDALARDGVHFKNAFVTTALCSPSRATILTGQYAHEHGVVDNNAPVRQGTVFFPSYLQDAGYETGFFGKWHMGREGDQPQPGFDKWVSFRGQGHYQAKTNGVQNTLNVDGRQVDQQGYITDELTDYALAWLAERDATKPFFLYLSHKAVHANFEPAQRHDQQYSDRQVTLPKSMSDTKENNAGKPRWVQDQRNSWHGVDFPYHSSLDIAEYKMQYHRTLSAVDESLGRIRSWLNENDLADNTIVVLMGDNGFLFGEHGLIDKRNAYEESMRVPLLASGPGFAAGKVVAEVVSNLNIAPTLLDFAGVERPDNFQGDSFRGLVSNGKATPDWNNEFVYEYFWEYTFPHTPTTFAIRNDRFKLIQYHGVWDLNELFDIENDPDEMQNLIDDPEYAEIQTELGIRLYKLLQTSSGENVVPYTQQLFPAKNYRNRESSDASAFPERWLKDNAE